MGFSWHCFVHLLPVHYFFSDFSLALFALGVRAGRRFLGVPLILSIVVVKSHDFEITSTLS